MVSATKMDFWIQHNYNILIVGKHGTGKSSVVIDAFNRAGLKWKYFSASTMDPWVDFIGVPKEKEDPDGNYLELVRPKEFQRDEIEALFFDEFNRASKKIRNAVLELIQFKSINGKKFNNLRIIWAAVNPEDEEDVKYDVEALDPAQADRFHIQVEMPYIPHLPYFKTVYGTPMAQAAVGWWKSLPEKVKDRVSPRRLDYALNVYQKNGDMRDVLPKGANVSKLVTEIKYGSIALRLKELFESRDKKEARKFFDSENNFTASIDEMMKKDEYLSFFFPILESEKIVALMSKNTKAMNFIINHSDQFAEILTEVMNADQNHRLVRRISKELGTGIIVLPSKDDFDCILNPKHKRFSCKAKGDYDAVLAKLDNSTMSNTILRYQNLEQIRKSLPLSPTEQQAVRTLEILSKIIWRSQTATLNQSYKFKDLLAIINHCFDTLYKSGNTDLRDIKTRHMKIGKAIDFGMSHPKTFYFDFIEK